MKKIRLTIAALVALTGVGLAPAVSPATAGDITPSGSVEPVWHRTAYGNARADRGHQPFVELGGTNRRPADKIRFVVRGSMVGTRVEVTVFIRCVAGVHNEFFRGGGFQRDFILADPDGDGMGSFRYSFTPFLIDTDHNGTSDTRSQFCHINPTIYLYDEDDPQGGFLSLALEYRKVTP